MNDRTAMAVVKFMAYASCADTNLPVRPGHQARSSRSLSARRRDTLDDDRDDWDDEVDTLFTHCPSLGSCTVTAF